MSEEAFLNTITPQVCQRIVSFHQGTRHPDQELVAALAQAAIQALGGPMQANTFQQAMLKVARLPQRASPENRLHRRRGCQFCQAACSYGYFSLISDPHFEALRELFAAEATKPLAEQTLLNPCLEFAVGRLEALSGLGQEFTERRHLANLSYCLLVLSMAKSRLAVPEQQLRLFQDANHAFVRSMPD